MLETCKFCGTVFEVDEDFLSQSVKWLKCSVCKQKWSVSSTNNKAFEEVKPVLKRNISSDPAEKVKHELASIKSAVENQTKTISKKGNPVLDQKNKTVDEIASELSVSKLKSEKKINNKIPQKKLRKKISLKKRIFGVFSVVIFTFCSLVLIFRSNLFGYTYLYFPKFSNLYSDRLKQISINLKLPIYAELDHINLKDFVATFQKEEIIFTGIVTNSSTRPVLVPRIKILVVREDRKIIFEKILVLNEKIIKPDSTITFENKVKLKLVTENMSVKATLLNKIYDY